MSDTNQTERERRWRLILGGHEADGIQCQLSAADQGMDATLASVYDTGREDASGGRRGGLGGSAPRVARWLGDIRSYFPSSVVRVMQQDALERLNLRQMLLEPEMLNAIDADVHMVANLVSLSGVIPEGTKDSARQVVRQVVNELLRKLASPTEQAVKGALNRAIRNYRPKHNEIDWPRTIRANLKHYQPEYKTIIPERRIGYGHKRSALRDIILCLDQSGSMATSVVYSGIFGAVLASIPAVKTRLIAFDTSVVDLSEDLQDPVDLLFGVQLGGGTDINRALGFCQERIDRPTDTILVLISDLYEGGNRQEMLKRAASLVELGVQVIALLALNDDGAPSYDHSVAEAFAGMGIPSFACTPDLFPDLMAAAINRTDMRQWAAKHDIVTARQDS